VLRTEGGLHPFSLRRDSAICGFLFLAFLSHLLAFLLSPFFWLSPFPSGVHFGEKWGTQGTNAIVTHGSC
jgi:hypothetical protein